MYRTRGDKTDTSVSHAAATKLSALYRQFLDRNFKHYLIICSPAAKHVSELKFISETQYNMPQATYIISGNVKPLSLPYVLISAA